MNSNTCNAALHLAPLDWVWRCEAARNWLALGLLLAAWNAADGDQTPNLGQRPPSLRGYACVSVRALQRTQTAPD
jgi:hypothetical protein